MLPTSAVTVVEDIELFDYNIAEDPAEFNMIYDTFSENRLASFPRRLALSLILLSGAVLTFEINLTRLYSVSQFYHFAFMIVSIALLGFGASGTFLAIFQGWGQNCPGLSLGWLCLAAALSFLGAYLLVNLLPFDSFSIAWDRRQVWILLIQYVALALPFFFGGMGVGMLLATYPLRAGQVYAANLLGSALGCLIFLLAPAHFGGVGTVVLSSGMAALAAAAAALGTPSTRAVPEPGVSRLRWGASHLRSLVPRVLLPLAAFSIFLFACLDLGSWVTGSHGIPGLELNLSPYKSLSYALQVPGAQVIYQRWSAVSRVDLVRSPGIHAFPGLSYRYNGPLPEEDGLLVDGDDLSPVVRSTADLEFTRYLPAAAAFRLRPQGEALVLEPRGGLDILTALAQGARQVTVVEENPLIVSAAGEIYRDARIRLEIESGRSYLRRTSDRFDIILLSLTSSYHPVRSGAYSLGEDYRYTVEAFQDALLRLKPDGFLVVTRWLQTPPSECLRTFALGVTAVERLQGDPRAQIVALRSYNTATVLIKNSPWTAGELQAIREFAGEVASDFNYAPGMRADETNRYNILPEPVYSQVFSALLDAEPREAFYARYPYAVAPPTDDHPFFGHFFKWSQAGQVLAELGRIWQPFGGAGYFVILALLLLALFTAVILIVLPAALSGRERGAAQPGPAALAYFGLIGLAFMLVEIPLIQRFILFLGQPAYALTAILFTLLFFSALGSRSSSLVSLRFAVGLLVVLLLASPWLLPEVFRLALGLPLAYRLGVTVVVVAPFGYLMGIPFPGGIRWMLGGDGRVSQIPWIWAVNGAASVVASVLAALLALSFGFDWVLRLGALCYAGSWLAVRVGSRRATSAHPLQ